MKKSILIFLFAIAISIASFAQTESYFNAYQATECAATMSHSGNADANIQLNAAASDHQVAIDYTQNCSVIAGPTLNPSSGVVVATITVDDGYDYGVVDFKVRDKINGVWQSWSTSGNNNGWMYVWPSTPGTPSGPSSPARSTNATYNISTVDGAAGYTWTITGGGYNIVSGQGTTSLTLQFTESYKYYGVSVRATSSCGSSDLASKSVYPIM